MLADFTMILQKSNRSSRCFGLWPAGLDFATRIAILGPAIARTDVNDRI
jgi:hypothetical protein